MSNGNSTTPLTVTSEELASLGFTMGDVISIHLKTHSRTNNAVRLGQINLNYLTDSGTIDTGSQSVWRRIAGVVFPATSTDDVVFGGDSTASAKIGFLNLAGEGTPTLAVRGNLFLDNPGHTNYLDLATNSSFNIRTQNNQGGSDARFTILPNGNIGIGTTTPTEKLEVAGNAKIDGTLQLSPIDAATAGACDPAATGKVYASSTDGNLYYCNGTTWTAIN
jgi:hypothetical protein